MGGGEGDSWAAGGSVSRDVYLYARLLSLPASRSLPTGIFFNFSTCLRHSPRLSSNLIDENDMPAIVSLQ